MDGSFLPQHTVDVVLRDGGHVRVRPVVPEDKQRLVDGMRRLSPQSRYRRFLSAGTELSPRTLTYLTELDYHDHYAWGALDLDEEDEPGVGVARYVRLEDDPEAAEVAVAVVDDHQRRGIGTLLLETVALTAAEHGVSRLVADVLAENAPVQAVLEAVGARLRWEASTGTVRAEVPVPAEATDLRDSALYDLLRAAARGEVEVAPPGPPTAGTASP